MSTPRELRWLWLREPRQQLAYILSDWGGALARLGNRIDRDAAGDYSLGYSEGLKMAAVHVIATTAMKREAGVKLFQRLGMPTDPDTLAKFGLADPVEESKQRARQAFEDRHSTL